MTGRRAVLLLAIVLFTASAPAVAAAYRGQEPVTEAPASEAEPAVEIDLSGPEPPAPQWTYRYLVPTTIAIGLASVAVSVVMYFVRVVRNRYTTVK